MTNNGMMRFVKSLAFGIASFPFKGVVRVVTADDVA
jgi:hypothetical protein